MRRTTSTRYFAVALSSLLALSGSARAASSFSNPLTGFTGNSTQPATQAALNAAGFNLFSTHGFIEDPPGEFLDPTITFDSIGANFGTLFAGDGGRNYLRTNDSDYANVRFVAEITVQAPNIGFQAHYFGLGPGNAAAFRTPDWTTPNSSLMYWGEVNDAEPFLTTLKNLNGFGPFVSTPAPGLVSGTHRLRLSYDWFRKVADISVDLNYAGGPFTADLSAAPIDVRDLYGADGWPTEPARIYFGGDDGVMFKDFQVNVTSPTQLLGDFNSSGTVNSADWVILRTNLRTDLSGKTHEQAYFLGDVTADLAINHADFAKFKSIYDAANGAGAFVAMVATVPEPATFALISLVASIIFCVARIRRITPAPAQINH
jgi:hypothetical protein